MINTIGLYIKTKSHNFQKNMHIDMKFKYRKLKAHKNIKKLQIKYINYIMLCINQNVISIIFYRKNVYFNLFISVFFVPYQSVLF